MLRRVKCFFDEFGTSQADRALLLSVSVEAAKVAKDMMHLKDYLALSAVLLHLKPRLVFEIGTYRGVTSNFILDVVQDCRVVSIAFAGRRSLFTRSRYNNTELTRREVGRAVKEENRGRFHQLYGDSHKLDAGALIEEFGHFDLVLVDGDHSRAGVRADSELAQGVIRQGGVICWHDANPKERYMSVRKYLEDELRLNAIATEADYIGGIACWSSEIENDAAAGR